LNAQKQVLRATLRAGSPVAARAVASAVADVRALIQSSPVIGYFAELASIPRPSRKEQRWVG